ncbi:MAG: hypothetical protein V9E81_09470 [Marmoricola sp.]
MSGLGEWGMVALRIDPKYRGPARSGNGGWTSGAFAARIRGDSSTPVEVTLRMPPPLSTDLDIVAVHDCWQLLDQDVLIAQARLCEARPSATDVVAFEEAQDASSHFPGLRHHPFPTCFTCGTAREDGLRIFPGPVGDGRVAAVWTPETQDEPTLWAALDCAGAWASDLEDRGLVLGQMTAYVDVLLRVGEPLIVVGEARGTQGRKVFSATSLFTTSGELVGAAEQIWIAIDPVAFNQLRERV